MASVSPLKILNLCLKLDNTLMMGVGFSSEGGVERVLGSGILWLVNMEMNSMINYY